MTVVDCGDCVSDPMQWLFINLFQRSILEHTLLRFSHQILIKTICSELRNKLQTYFNYLRQEKILLHITICFALEFRWKCVHTLDIKWGFIENWEDSRRYESWVERHAIDFGKACTTSMCALLTVHYTESWIYLFLFRAAMTTFIHTYTHTLELELVVIIAGYDDHWWERECVPI